MRASRPAVAQLRPEDCGLDGSDDRRTPAERDVRLAWAADAPGIAAVQAADLAVLLARQPTGDAAVTAADLEPVWRHAITRPPSARHRVLVAVELHRLVGFAATGPAEDRDSDAARDGEVVALHAVRNGHGGPRATAGLLGALAAAAADTLAADGFQRAQIWLAADDDDLRAALHAAGWTADGASRALGDDPDPSGAYRQPLRQIRLHVGLGDGTAPD